MNYCSQCGNKLVEDSKYCESCGKSVKAEIMTQQIEKNISVFKLSRDKFHQFANFIRNNLGVMFILIIFIMILLTMNPRLGWIVFFLSIIFSYWYSNSKTSSEHHLNKKMRENIENLNSEEIKNFTNEIIQATRKNLVDKKEDVKQMLEDNKEKSEIKLSEESLEEPLEKTEMGTAVKSNNTIWILSLVGLMVYLFGVFFAPFIHEQISGFGYGANSDITLSDFLSVLHQVEDNLYSAIAVTITFLPILSFFLIFMKHSVSIFCQYTALLFTVGLLIKIILDIRTYSFSLGYFDISSSSSIGFGLILIIIGLSLMFASVILNMRGVKNEILP